MSVTYTYYVDGLSDRVKELRTARQLSQEALARKIGKAGNSVGRIERGGHGAAAETVLALAQFFGVTTDYLLTGEEPALGGDVLRLPPPGLNEFLASPEGEGLSDEERAGLITVGHGLTQMGKTPTPYTYAAVVGILRTLR